MHGGNDRNDTGQASFDPDTLTRTGADSSTATGVHNNCLAFYRRVRHVWVNVLGYSADRLFLAIGPYHEQAAHVTTLASYETALEAVCGLYPETAWLTRGTELFDAKVWDDANWYRDGSGEDTDDAHMTKRGYLMANVSTWRDKRFVQGIAQAFGLASGQVNQSGVDRLKNMLARFSVPLSGAQVAAREAIMGDESERQKLHTFLDRVKSNTLYTGGMEPQRDWFGSPQAGSGLNHLLPTPIKVKTQDPVLLEMERVGMYVPKQAHPTEVLGVKLADYRNNKDQTALDRWGELRGTHRIGGYTLKESIARLIKSREYTSQTADGFEDAAQKQGEMIAKVSQQFNAEIRQQVFREFPELSKAYKASNPKAKLEGFSSVISMPK